MRTEDGEGGRTGGGAVGGKKLKNSIRKRTAFLISTNHLIRSILPDDVTSRGQP